MDRSSGTPAVSGTKVVGKNRTKTRKLGLFVKSPMSYNGEGLADKWL